MRQCRAVRHGTLYATWSRESSRVPFIGLRRTSELSELDCGCWRVGRRHRPGRPRQKPVRVVADKAYDSDPPRKRLHRRGIEPICPHKKNRVRPATQDGRAWRRYRRRWIVERAIGWLGNFRRLVVRYDRSLRIYRAFFHIACFMASCGGSCSKFEVR